MVAQLNAKIREHKTKSEAKSIRSQGWIPAVVYGKTMESEPISVSSVDFIKVMRESGKNGIINLEVNGTSHSVMVHDLQTNPLKDEVIHIDFFQVNMNKKIHAEVPVHLVGEAIGQRDGGIVQQPVRELKVNALPSEIPAHIEVNIEGLEIGNSISVADIKANQSVEILNDDDEVVVSVLQPAREEEPLQQEPEDSEGSDEAPNEAGEAEEE